MNRLSEYITGMTLTRMYLREANILINRPPSPAADHAALRNLIQGFSAFVAATNNVISIQEGKKPKKARKKKGAR